MSSRLTLTQPFKKTYLRVFLAFSSASLSFPAEPPQRQSAEWPNLGFLYDNFSLTLKAGERTEMFGPIFGSEKSDSSTLFNFSPLFSLYRDSIIPQVEAELGYPILSFDKFGREYRFQIFQFISFSGGESSNQEIKSRLTLFPLYFHQRSTNPEQNYTAVAPFYGELNNRLFRDKISFIMVPLYLKTEKRGVITENYLFPVFHHRHGAGVEGWQFWPVVGQEHKEITTTTNQWGESVVSGGHDKFFALWPFFFKTTVGTGTTNVQTQLAVLPFYVDQQAPSRSSRFYGFPFGYSHTIDRARRYEEWGAPWPLVIFARGPGKHANRVWPFFSQARNATHQSAFYAWPIYKYNRVTSGPLDRERTRIAFFLYSDLIERNLTNNTALQRRDFWPLFTWRKDHQGSTRLQALSLLEPLLPGNKSIERVYSPVYALYRQERSGVTGDSSRSILWNLYRSEVRGEKRRQSALFGLFQREKTPERTRWRVLFVPFTTRDQPKPQR